MRFVRLFVVALSLALLAPARSGASPDPEPEATEATDTTDARDEFADASGDTIPPAPGDSIPQVLEITTRPRRPSTSYPVVLILEGSIPDHCVEVVNPAVADSHHVSLTLDVSPCEEPASWRQEFELGRLSAGYHEIVITFAVVMPDGAAHRYRRTYQMVVVQDAPTVPPDSLRLPYIDAVLVGPAEDCTGPGRPICSGDSIVVEARGHFPSTCFVFRKVEMITGLYSPVPEPPIVRFIVDDQACLGQPCADVLVPWQASVTLPPLPGRDYNLIVQMVRVTCADSVGPGDSVYVGRVPFVVADSCANDTRRCLAVGWNGGLTTCDARVSPGVPAQLTMRLRTPVALSGLQGELRLTPPALRITNIEATGPAEGMLVRWSALEGGGAKFLMFAEHGAPIPPTTPCDEAIPGVLRVTVEQPDSGRRAPSKVILTPSELLGSDIKGQGLEMCWPPPWVRIDPTLWFAAAICTDRPCDFNGDGYVDVRDLVLMVHCVNGDGRCPDQASLRFDCNGDSALAIEDVLCCARRILSGAPCADCPPDTTAPRSEPSVAVELGEPTETSAGVTVPLHVSGSDRVGAAKLVLQFPSDRFDRVDVDLQHGGEQWLVLSEVRDDRVVIGLIQVGSGEPAAPGEPSDLPLVVRFALRPGQDIGGEIKAVESEFSGPDGVRLAVDLGAPSLALREVPSLELSENRPEPFSGRTRFTLTLGRSDDVEVGIFDIGGRLVKTLHRGLLEAGTHPFEWNGTQSDGRTAPSGVYFCRAVAAGVTSARKLTLLRSQ